MIESVNTVLSSPQLLRGGAEQVVPAETSQGSEVREVAPAPRAPFISPFIAIDTNFDTAVLQIRDSETGDVLRQFPSEARLRAQSLVESSEGLVSVSEAIDVSEAPRAPTAGGAASSASFVEVQSSGGGQVASEGSTAAPLAQIASAALASGAQSGLSSLSAGVSVLA